ncbi:cytochrome P450 [Paraphoma chrysanthemicola]|nr:cytochrome P450 [Paraphoma chrysanthemicola]
MTVASYLPILRHLSSLEIAAWLATALAGLEKLHHKYGPIVRIGPNEVSIDDWRQLRVIYANSKTALKDGAFYHSATFVGRNNIFQMTNPVEHGGRRKMSNSSYALRSITQLDPLIRDKAEAFARRLLDEAETSPNKTADAYKLCGLFSFETICKSAFAKEFDDALADRGALKLLQSMERSAITLIFDGVFPFLRSTGLGARLPGSVGEAYRSLQYWEEESRNMVDHFLAKSSADAKFLLSPIATGVDGFLGRKLNHEELVEEAMGYMFAGSGTTSSTLTYLLYALSLPENTCIQEQLRDEIRNIPANDMNALRQNAFVNAVIKETFRRFPTIISTLPRVLQGPLHIGETLIPAGTVVGMQNWMHHRNPEVFPNHDQFLPARWLHSSEAMEGSLTPFSIGQRNCIGQNLAWEELYIAVDVLMRAGLKFRIGSEMKIEEMEMEDRFNIAPRGRRLMLEVEKVTF